jgi:hypothetical protein
MPDKAGAGGPEWAESESGPLRDKERKGRRKGVGRGERREGWAGGRQSWAASRLGRWFGFVFFFSFSFSIPLQIFFKPFQIFYIFSNSNFNTNFSNYFKGFSQTLLTTFQTYFKLKPSFF